MKVAIYGGMREVGGNKVLLQTARSKALLDFGLSYAQRGRFFSDPFLSPKSKRTLLELGVTQPLDGVYWFQEVPDEHVAVFLSHAHKDHYGHVSLLNKRIPVFCGTTAHVLLDCLLETQRETQEFDLSGRCFRRFKTGDIVKVNDIEVQPIHVDHSVPGSYGFIVHGDGKTIAYSGDLRMHGRMSSLTEDFREALSNERPDVLIVEHTNILDGEVSDEADVERGLLAIIRRIKGLVVSDFSNMDIDRYRTFRAVADKTGRELVMMPKRAFLLMKLRTDTGLSLPKLEGSCVLKIERKQIRRWEQSVYRDLRTLAAEELACRQDKYLLLAPMSEMETLAQMRPVPGSCYIYSSSEPFNEEMEIDFSRLMNWLEFLGMPFYHVHASGHIMPVQIRQLVADASPKHVIPIHGTHPELLSRFVRDLCPDVRIPNPGETLEV